VRGRPGGRHLGQRLGAVTHLSARQRHRRAAGSFNGPGPFSDAVVVDNSGTFLHIADSSSNSRIWRTSLIGTVLSSFSVPYDVEGMTQLANGNLVLANANIAPSSIVTVNPSTGAVISSFNTTVAIDGLDTDGTSEIYGLQSNGVINSIRSPARCWDRSPPGHRHHLGLASTGSSFFIASTSGRDDHGGDDNRGVHPLVPGARRKRRIHRGAGLRRSRTLRRSRNARDGAARFDGAPAKARK
jgi:hypothetical protein